MIDWSLARRYQAAGLGLAGVLLKQSLYPRSALLRAFEGAPLVLDLGCGEGLLTNLLAAALPRSRFVGVDLDAEKVRVAGRCRVGTNVEFQAGSLFAITQSGAAGILFNDVLHHLAPADQERALEFASQRLDDSGVLVLKEVAATDALDKAHTTFWDRRFYPRDALHFRTLPDWISLAGRHGFRLINSVRVRHPWIASRSLLVFTKRPRTAPAPRPAPMAAGQPPVRVLLTGGTGFIGEWVLRELLGGGIAGSDVRVGVVTRRPWSVPRAATADRRVEIIAADLAQPLAPGALGAPWDYAFHLAAEVDYFGGPATYRNNLSGTTHLLETLRALNVRRLIFASTMGAVDRGRFDDCTRPLDEDSPAHPTSPYGRAKIEEEKLVRASGIPHTIIRIPWCYGPGMSPTHHVRRLLNDVRRNSIVTRVAWPGRISLVAVEDAARIFVAAASEEGAANRTFSISDGQPVAFGELFAEMGRTVGNARAGSIFLPRLAAGMLRRLHFLLPFQMKALVCDALVVANARPPPPALTGAVRPSGFLQPLARHDALERWPERWRHTVVVTGAASGIGRALARQFHAHGYHLSLVDRDTAALPPLAGLLGAEAHLLDLSDLNPGRALEQLAGERAPDVVIVVNNAGLGFHGGYATIDPASVKKMLDVNVEAVVVSTIAFSREMSRRGGGIIVNIASSAAFQPLPYMAVYAASKAFVHLFTLAAGAERGSEPVCLLAVSPSGVRTNFQASGGVRTSEGERLLTPEQVASGILRTIERRRTSVIIGRRGAGMALYARLVPMRVLLATWEILMRRLH